MPFLYEKYDTLSEYGALPKEIPETIITNLNPVLELREYQKEALKRFFHYYSDDRNRVKPTQLLFHMATGSGKTLIMAAIILYLYEKRYRNFIYFVNSTNIIEKTRDNFLNPASPKFLFDERIKFGTKRVSVKEVENFEAANESDISILFTTVQGLHSRLNAPRENSLTYEDFQQKRIVMLSDEAHHINALTKRSLTISERVEIQSWEGTVNRVFRANPENLLLEFTATVELRHPAVSQKYEDKILFEYSLKKFREDGFSKDVKVLETDLEPLDRALQAIVVSQYRRKVAEQYKLRLKPVLLMKSKTIAVSKEIEGRFHDLIKKLSRRDIDRIRKNARDVVLKAFQYFEKRKIDLDDLVEELKLEFAPERCVSVNSKDESVEKQILVNTLEDKNNEIRVVFAVDMLNEGWDVLNLFDIVRLYETRDARGGQPGNTTISEAQLIGRGARYFPFKLSEDQDKYKRKYDLDLNNELRILEELHYHSSHNPRYIQELRTALVQTGIWPNRSRTIQVKIKDEIKNTDFWKKGILFLNKKIANSKENIFGLSDIKVPSRFFHRLRTGLTSEITIFADTRQEFHESGNLALNLNELGIHVIRKALNRIDFYRFVNLKSFFPNLRSISEFISSEKYLGGLTVELAGLQYQVKDLSADTKLDIAVDVLHQLSLHIQSKTTEYIGTKIFFPHSVSTVAKDKELNIVLDTASDQEFGREMSQPANHELYLNLKEKPWYVYNENYGTSEEKYFIKFINTAIDALKERYAEVYLLRNESLFQLYRFSDGAAIEPDFVLFLRKDGKKKYIMYQLFVEAKGDRGLIEDKWKEDFLLEIEKEYKLELVYEDREFKLIGMPFYNENLRSKFEAGFNLKVISNV